MASGLTHLSHRRTSPLQWPFAVFHAWVDPQGYSHVIPRQTTIVEIGSTSATVE